MSRSFSRAGFTLMEVLVAMAFLAILVPALVSALSTANRVSLTADRGATAMQLAENKLNEMLLGDAWTTGETQGDFGELWPNYRWELQSTDWAQATEMTELTMLVHYQVQGQERSAQLSTLVQTTTP